MKARKRTTTVHHAGEMMLAAGPTKTSGRSVDRRICVQQPDRDACVRSASISAASTTPGTSTWPVGDEGPGLRVTGFATGRGRGVVL
jgi:hypothetical protein